MKVIIGDKEYTAAPFVAHHAMMMMEIQGESEQVMVSAMIQTVSESLVKGMERIDYDKITDEKLKEYSKMLTMNTTLKHIAQIFQDLMQEMNEGAEVEGKPKRSTGKR